MERVGTLINKLQEQFEQQADSNRLLMTVQMLLAELQQKQTTNTSGKVSVLMPAAVSSQIVETVVVEEQSVIEHNSVLEQQPIEVQEKPVEVIVVEAKPEPVEQELATKKEEHSGWLFDPVVTTIPTLAHHEVKEVFELNTSMIAEEEPESHNEKLKETKIEVAAALQGSPVKDLKKAIGINDRYLFINELFRGDEAMYERSIKTINSFNIFPEAEYWIQREMKTKLGWTDDNETVKLFDQLVKRRFS